MFAVMQVHIIPASSAGVARLLGTMGIEVTRKQVNEWVKKFGKYVEVSRVRAPVKYGRIWHVDEMHTKVNGEKGWLFKVVDEHGNTLAFWFSRRKDQNAADMALRIAEKRTGMKPDRIVRDGAKSYDAVAKRKAWRDIPQTKAHFRGKKTVVRGKFVNLSNNRVEGHHAITRMHLTLRRGEKRVESTNLFLRGKIFFRNIMRAKISKRHSGSYRLFVPWMQIAVLR